MSLTTVTTSGFAELDAALADLGKRAAKSTLRRAGQKALKPLVEKAKARVPVRFGDIKGGLAVSTRLSRQEKRQLRRRQGKGGGAWVQLFAGVTNFPHAHMVEFGTVNMAPQPYLRPAWASEKRAILNRVAQELTAEIAKAAKRQARRAAKGTGGRR